MSLTRAQKCQAYRQQLAILEEQWATNLKKGIAAIKQESKARINHHRMKEKIEETHEKRINKKINSKTYKKRLAFYRRKSSSYQAKANKFGNLVTRRQKKSRQLKTAIENKKAQIARECTKKKAEACPVNSKPASYKA